MLGFIGDIHGRWEHLRRCWTELEAAKVTTAIQVGDFGMWPEVWPPKGQCPMETFVADGNHEHFWWMKERGWFESPRPVKIAAGCWYVPRGQVLRFEHKNILFMGGAESIDVLTRMTGRDWFPEEAINFAQFETALAACEGLTIDMVVSHDCPTSFTTESEFVQQTQPNNTRDALQAILEEVKPRQWVFGHHHITMSGQVGETTWHCVGMEKCIILP